MTDREQIEHLANGVIGDLARMAECQRYYAALLKTLNTTHHDGEQDAFALFEALSMVLGQILGNHPANIQGGILTYIRDRAIHHADVFKAAGKAAPYIVEAAPDG